MKTETKHSDTKDTYALSVAKAFINEEFER